ncbi:hypothetical protein PR048_004703 [Dryococelus australis]|uniref:Reverse transcriptase Ty1/copia-type domain-containing protein n=1 Tax=Dryococelus australis TaxID=614101 RepID=A0ABQ9I653_9NEOP|nr:hypothetical protein PR048_004703 [Dryococelus australis]
MTSLETFLSAAVQKEWSIDHLDMKCTFLYGELDKPVYMKVPEGVIVKEENGNEHDEYVALASAATKFLYVKNILTEILALPEICIEIFEDNQSCIKICSTSKTKRSKYISVKIHFVKGLVLERKISMLS